MKKVSLKPGKLCKKPAPSAAEKKAREAEIRAEKVFAARLKFERLIARCYDLNSDDGHFKLVSEPGDDGEEGEFEPEELALVPTDQLGNYIAFLEETEEVARTMSQEIREAWDARQE